MVINIANYERQTEILNKTDKIIEGLSSGGKTKRIRTFTSNGTWTAPQGVTEVFVTGGGAGGSGGVYATAGGSPGSAGSATSFGSLLTLSGGGGGSAGSTDAANALGGVSGGSGGQTGQVGGAIGSGGTGGMSYLQGGGGSSGPFNGGTFTFSKSYSARRGGGYCSGGAGIVSATAGVAPGGGGGDFVFNKELNVTPGQSYNIVIGVGGASVGTSNERSGAGGNGILIIEWWE